MRTHQTQNFLREYKETFLINQNINDNIMQTMTYIIIKVLKSKIYDLPKKAFIIGPKFAEPIANTVY